LQDHIPPPIIVKIQFLVVNFAMRIFLSFPSELQAKADDIAQSLRNSNYDVFFSHDDLPPGDSFDGRVEQAIQSSDCMVFLISPESVTRGRYTLTELAFAKSKWPNPSNHVLPVMVAPTALDQVPIYLKAVTILEPQGSTAAETRAAVERMLQANDATLDLPVVPLVGLSLASAVCCCLAVVYANNLLLYSFVLSGAERVTVIPGLIFGLAVAACNFIFGARDRFQLGLVVVVTTLAWVAAWDSSLVTLRVLGEYSKAAAIDSSSLPADTPPAEAARETLSNMPITGYIIGCVGGAVGGAITILGVLLINVRFRRIDSVATCWIAATVAGGAYGLLTSLPSWLGWLILFATWQTVVIMVMAREFPRGTAQLPEWLGRLAERVSPISSNTR
jgi:hypothetical protein